MKSFIMILLLTLTVSAQTWIPSVTKNRTTVLSYYRYATVYSNGDMDVWIKMIKPWKVKSLVRWNCTTFDATIVKNVYPDGHINVTMEHLGFLGSSVLGVVATTVCNKKHKEKI